AIALDPNSAVYFSNRSAAYAALERWREALDDAVEACSLKPDWGKGHLRSRGGGQPPPCRPPTERHPLLASGAAPRWARCASTRRRARRT
ncbi:hypothetical protein EMIHUDRAFT_67958, partial [Emiliania huxleyi CCMP1516]|uniref:Uncharacterized protein n=2 Tax=Emiliania huxleyi TaxID=2903 RepID=A0A0D3IDB5_EMIH1